MQPRCQFIRQCLTPRFINESHADQVAEMSAVLVAERREFHPHGRSRRNTRNVSAGSESVTSGAGNDIIGSHIFTGEDDVDRIPGFRVRTIEEKIDAGNMPIDEARRFKSRLGRAQIRSKDQQVHVLREAYGRLIDLPNPRGDRIAADYRVRNTRIF